MVSRELSQTTKLTLHHNITCMWVLTELESLKEKGISIPQNRIEEVREMITFMDIRNDKHPNELRNTLDNIMGTGYEIGAPNDERSVARGPESE